MAGYIFFVHHQQKQVEIGGDHVAKFLGKRFPHCNIKFKRHKLYSTCSNYVAKIWFNCGIEGCSLDGNVLDKRMLLHVNNLSTSLTHTRGKPKSF